MRDFRTKLQLIAKEIQIGFDETESFSISDWREMCIRAGIGFDPRTANSWLQVALVKGLIKGIGRGQYMRGYAFDSFIVKELKQQ
ncbi:MAG: hypothetical protein QXT42_03370 [Thermoplasmata archaeon]